MHGPGECDFILIVDDDKDIRDSVAEVLEDEGYHVSHASNGAEALSRLRAAGVPCVIILDLMMPIMDGWQFRTEQLQDPQLSDIPVIVLSADGNARQKAVTMKALAGLTKPVRLEQLLSVVQEVCAPAPA
jgi:CheY-like chemotaxis protein